MRRAAAAVPQGSPPPLSRGTCFGDSGGPVLFGDTVLAVTSFVINGNCAGAGYSFRIDRPEILEWIQSFL